jgi:hypothetical protein
VVAVVLQKTGRTKSAGLFVQHVIRLIASHRVAVERWMSMGRAGHQG